MQGFVFMKHCELKNSAAPSFHRARNPHVTDVTPSGGNIVSRNRESREVDLNTNGRRTMSPSSPRDGEFSPSSSSSSSSSSSPSSSYSLSGFTTFASQTLKPPTTGVYDAPPPRPPLRNPGWQGRIAEGTTYGFGAGLLGGALYAAWMEEVNVAPAVAGVAGNVALVTATFLGCKELTQLMRQEDDWVNSAVGGALSGSICAVAFKGRAYSASGALLFATVAGGIHFLYEADSTGSLYQAVGFKVIDRPDGTKDWVTPAWFPIRRVSDDELEANEIDFQLRVNAVIEGRMTPEEAGKVRAEYRERRRIEKLRRDGLHHGDSGAPRETVIVEAFETEEPERGERQKWGLFRGWWGGGKRK